MATNYTWMNLYSTAKQSRLSLKLNFTTKTVDGIAQCRSEHSQ
jgi:hypothetical protein